MKVVTAEFKKAVNTVKPAIASKEIIEQTTSFAFVGGRVIGYNDEISISCPLELSESLSGAIKAEELYKFLSKVNKDEFEILFDDQEIVMKAGRAKAGFAVVEEILLPLDEEIVVTSDWVKLPENFAEACLFAANSASKGFEDQKLTCVHIFNGKVEATDNYRLMVWNLGEALMMPETLIPAIAIKEVVKLKPTLFSVGEGWMHFMNANNVMISCRVVDEKFVDTENINTSIVGETVVFNKEIFEVLDKAEIFCADMKDASVTLSFKEGRTMVQSQNKTSWFKENVPCDTKAKFTFSITPYLLKDILKKTMTCVIGNGMLKFEGEGWIYVTGTREFIE